MSIRTAQASVVTYVLTLNILDMPSRRRGHSRSVSRERSRSHSRDRSESSDEERKLPNNASRISDSDYFLRSQQQPEKGGGASTGCMACLAGCLCCCCAEGASTISCAVQSETDLCSGIQKSVIASSDSENFCCPHVLP